MATLVRISDRALSSLILASALWVTVVAANGHQRVRRQLRDFSQVMHCCSHSLCQSTPQRAARS
jgi:hypothetical protein